ncbi:MAG TPA: hypothetical protein VFL64_15420 [Rhizobacter sp.]|nr:hypothetical protein [Rhizobacter sp.]
MAISWLSALKVIPWGDVIEAAPQVVKGARKMFTRTQQPEPAAPAAPAADPAERVSQLEARVARLQEQQQASAQLMETLAEQNARLVEAVEILRVRTRFLLVVSGVLAVVLAGTIAWSLR